MIRAIAISAAVFLLVTGNSFAGQPLKKGESQVFCDKGPTMEGAVSAVNQLIAADRTPPLAIPTLNSRAGGAVVAAQPFSVSAPTIFQSGSVVYVCVTITK